MYILTYEKLVDPNKPLHEGRFEKIKIHFEADQLQLALMRLNELDDHGYACTLEMLLIRDYEEIEMLKNKNFETDMPF